MGLRLFSPKHNRCSGPMILSGRSTRPPSCYDQTEERHPLEPDPEVFKILGYRCYGTFWVYVVKYPNCINYEGKKVLVTRGRIDEDEPFDPHFLENSILLARFRPTYDGLRDAIQYAKRKAK